MGSRSYIAIDLKSFYASVECVQRGLNPLTTNLVVADRSRTDKTICLAVSPSLKAYGIPGRIRLFEIEQRLAQINSMRQMKIPGNKLNGSSWDDTLLKHRPDLAVDYIAAPPQMARYIAVSTRIYQIYLKYIAPEDIHIYSIDEVFIDATKYLKLYDLTAKELAVKIILDILESTGITATAGIGTNLYLSKVAMDIVAKHLPADRNGVRVAQLDETTYRHSLWSHRPLTDFWRVGRGYVQKLEHIGLTCMGDIARCSLGSPSDYYNEGLLYRMFGINAELLIDHAWGWEPCTMADIKAYKPAVNSLGSGQVLQYAYPANKARLVLREMADQLAADLLDKGLVTDRITVTVGYDTQNLADPARAASYQGAVTTDHYDRKIPRHAHGTAALRTYTSSSREILESATTLYDRIVDPALTVRRLNIAAGDVIDEARFLMQPEQLDLFTGCCPQQTAQNRERQKQETVLSIKKKFGKNAIFKGMDLEDGATALARNGQIGGHKA